MRINVEHEKRFLRLVSIAAVYGLDHGLHLIRRVIFFNSCLKDMKWNENMTG